MGNLMQLLSSLPSFQFFHIVFLGLDCAEKTSVFYRLQFNEFVNTVLTKGFYTEKISVTLGNPKSHFSLLGCKWSGEIKATVGIYQMHRWHCAYYGLC
uniref:Uncharacterized protein n=1 Tax=Prolemur simus TaxID=1328070 RepID=A0A8C8YLT4_PROSS